MNKQVRNARILVTGGAGFIGSNLCEVFLAQDNEVVCLDNYATGHHTNLSHLKSHPRLTMIEGDICNLADCQRAVDGVEYVVHQAALGSVPRSLISPIRSNMVNVDGFLNMLVAARDAGVRRFIYASSSSVYGDSEDMPKIEGGEGAPLSPYAVTKAVNELYAKVFSRSYGMETIGLRYFNVFGRRQNPEGAYAAVIPRFVLALMQHKRPQINGQGEYSRDFTHVSNVVLANQLAMLVENPEAVNTVYNVACNERTTLNELVAGLKENLAHYDPAIADIEPEYGAYRAGDVPHSLASIEKSQRLLGYEPVTFFREGLREAAAWYWERLR